MSLTTDVIIGVIATIVGLLVITWIELQQRRVDAGVCSRGITDEELGAQVHQAFGSALTDVMLAQPAFPDTTTPTNWQAGERVPGTLTRTSAGANREGNVVAADRRRNTAVHSVRGRMQGGDVQIDCLRCGRDLTPLLPAVWTDGCPCSRLTLLPERGVAR